MSDYLKIKDSSHTDKRVTEWHADSIDLIVHWLNILNKWYARFHGNEWNLNDESVLEKHDIHIISSFGLYWITKLLIINAKQK